MRAALLLCLVIQTSGMAQTSSAWSEVKMTTIRLSPRHDLKHGLIEFAKKHKITAGFVASCVGSLEQANIRFANEETGTLLKGHYEIVSLVGTFSQSSSHLHISISDSNGKTIGGHLLDNNLVYTTAEIVIGNQTQLEFDRITDSTYGYKELEIKPVKKN